MKAYELLYFVSPTLDDESKSAVEKRINDTIAEGKGTVDKHESWGKRKLAYEINELTDAEYFIVDFHADEQSISELDRVLRISDKVVRHMITARTDRD